MFSWAAFLRGSCLPFDTGRRAGDCSQRGSRAEFGTLPHTAAPARLRRVVGDVTLGAEPAAAPDDATAAAAVTCCRYSRRYSRCYGHSRDATCENIVKAAATKSKQMARKLQQRKTPVIALLKKVVVASFFIRINTRSLESGDNKDIILGTHMSRVSLGLKDGAFLVSWKHARRLACVPYAQLLAIPI